MKVIAIGDSCCYGQGVRSCEAWPAVLEQLTGHDVRNAGVCGDTTRLALERFPNAVALHQPDVVVIQLGLNDANRWQSDHGPERVGINAYVANMHDLVDRVRALNAKPIVLRPHQPNTSDTIYNERVTLYSLTLRESTLGPEFGLCAPEVSLLNDGYGVHPDVAMHQRYAEKVADALQVSCDDLCGQATVTAPLSAVIAYRRGAVPWCCPCCGSQWTEPRWRVLVCPNNRCRFTFPLP